MDFPVVVYFYSSFKKRINSTKRPLTGVTIKNCYIKDKTDMLNPTIVLTDYNENWNYAVIIGDNIDRYFFIEKAVFNEGLWEYTLIQDNLATFKSDIGDSTCFVLRSSYTYTEYIADDTYILKGEKSELTVLGNPFVTNYQNGTFILSVVGEAGFTYYAMPYGSLRALFASMMDDNLYGPDLDKNTYNPLNFIKKITYIPISIEQQTGIPISIGWITFPNVTGAYQVYPGYTTITRTFTKPSHPDASTKGKFLNLQPYSKYKLRYGPFGEINLSGEGIGRATTLTILITLDNITGEAVISVNDTTTSYGYSKAAIGVDIEAGTYSVSKLLKQIDKTASTATAVLSVIGMGVGAYLGSPTAVIAGAAGVISSVSKMDRENVINSTPSVTTTGSLGSFADLAGNTGSYGIIHTYTEIGETDFSRNGRPYCVSVNLSTIPGFILCRDGEIDMKGNYHEKMIVKHYLENGFFYE